MSEDLHKLTPEEVLINKQSEEEMRDKALYKYAALFYAVSGDSELEEVLDAVINGCELKPRFLAQALNVPVQNIYNRMRRLRRKAVALK